MHISDWSSDVCSSDLFPLSGALVGLLAALLVAVIAILLRQIGRTEPAATTVFWFSALSLPPLGIVYLFNLQPHDPATWAVLVGIGLIGGLGQLAITASVRFAPVATVVPMDYSSLIWGISSGRSEEHPFELQSLMRISY